MSKAVAVLLLSLISTVATAVGNVDEPNSRKLAWSWGRKQPRRDYNPSPAPTETYEKDDTPAITVDINSETITLFKQAKTLKVSTAAFCQPLVECVATCYLEPYWHFFGHAQQDCFAKHTSELAVCQHYMTSLFSSHGLSYPAYETYSQPDWRPSGGISTNKVVQVVQYVKQSVTKSEANSARRAINDIDNAGSSQVVLKFKTGSFVAIEEVRRMAAEAKKVVKEYSPFARSVIKRPTKIDESPSAHKRCDEITRTAVMDKTVLEKGYGAKVSYSNGVMNIRWD